MTIDCKDSLLSISITAAARGIEANVSSLALTVVGADKVGASASAATSTEILWLVEAVSPPSASTEVATT